jgi:hypothetical protein
LATADGKVIGISALLWQHGGKILDGTKPAFN